MAASAFERNLLMEAAKETLISTSEITSNRRECERRDGAKSEFVILVDGNGSSDGSRKLLRTCVPFFFSFFLLRFNCVEEPARFFH